MVGTVTKEVDRWDLVLLESIYLCDTASQL
jgi:hypothetical protein